MNTIILLHIPDGMLFEGDQGYCFLCKKGLTSPEQKQEHESGKKHKRIAALAFGSEDESRCSGHDNRIRCRECNVPLVGEENIQKHLRENHPDLANLTDRQSAAEPVSLLTDFSLMSVAAAQFLSRSQDTSRHGFTLTSARPDSSLERDSAQLSQQQNTSVSGVRELEDRFRAITLGVGNNSLPQNIASSTMKSDPASGSLVQAAQHGAAQYLPDETNRSDNTTTVPNVFQDVSVATHGFTEENPESIVYPLDCQTCSKEFSGQESAKQHFLSGNHKDKIHISDLLATGSAELDPDTGAYITVERGSVKKYICKVCLCLMNTMRDYSNHTSKKQHTDMVQKQLDRSQSFTSDSLEIEEYTTPGSPNQMNINVDAYDEDTTPKSYAANVSVDTSNDEDITQKMHATRSSERWAQNQLNTQKQLNVNLDCSDAEDTTSKMSHSKDLSSHLGASRPGVASPDAGSSCQDIHGTETSRRVEPATGTNKAKGNNNVERDRGSSNPGMDSNQSTILPTGNTASVSDHRVPVGTPPRPDGPTSKPSSENLGQGPRSSGGGRKGRGGQVVSLDRDYGPDSGGIRPGEHRTDLKSEDGESLSDTASEGSSVSNNESFPGTGTSRQHLPNELSASTKKLARMSDDWKNFPVRCDLCEKGMNTQKDLRIHNDSFTHYTNSALVPAPDKSYEPLMKTEVMSDTQAYYSSCATMPRHYQIELICKTMASESTLVCLPTGTGKTLIAIMAIQRMLTLNETRPVLFLTNNVLLVLQQADKIKKELGEQQFNRPDLDQEGRMVRRAPKVAVLCGGLSVREATPLWKYDIIVLTAGYCHNLLQEGSLRWGNFSLVIFDEAHHCKKGHPYKKLLDKYHAHLATTNREPKILGLTASPASKPTAEGTLEMLKTLLRNLGGAKIATVDKDSNERAEQISSDILKLFSPDVTLKIICVPRSDTETDFQTKLFDYFLLAYKLLLENSSLKRIHKNEGLVPSHIEGMEELSIVLKISQSDQIKPLEGLSDSEEMNKFMVLQMHTKAVGHALLCSEDGIDFVLEDLEHIFSQDLNPDLQTLANLGLPCQDIFSYIDTLCNSRKLRIDEEFSGRLETAVQQMSVFQKLLETLENPTYIDWSMRGATALILIRERETADTFQKHLKESAFVQHLNMQVDLLVGHGAGSGDGAGMKLRTQDKVLQKIQSQSTDRKIVVATSVAEEGIDIPECQLVVCLNPPPTVKSLVQMRGRAREKNSFFVALCSNQQDERKLRDLLAYEKNMKCAVAHLLHTD